MKKIIKFHYSRPNDTNGYLHFAEIDITNVSFGLKWKEIFAPKITELEKNGPILIQKIWLETTTETDLSNILKD